LTVAALRAEELVILLGLLLILIGEVLGRWAWRACGAVAFRTVRTARPGEVFPCTVEIRVRTGAVVRATVRVALLAR
jgi:hypothetical protein